MQTELMNERQQAIVAALTYAVESGKLTKEQLPHVQEGLEFLQSGKNPATYSKGVDDAKLSTAIRDGIEQYRKAAGFRNKLEKFQSALFRWNRRREEIKPRRRFVFWWCGFVFQVGIHVDILGKNVILYLPLCFVAYYWARESKT